MKILCGKLKGRNFFMPEGIRPTPNIIRKAVFDLLGQDLSGLDFLDLFAGSGAVVLEALSLGARNVTAVERDLKGVQVIEENIQRLGIESFELIAADAFKAIKQFAAQKRRFDIVFLDPPYGREAAKKTLNLLKAYDIFKPIAFIIIQHDKHETLPETPGRFLLIRHRKYGTSYLSVYKTGD